MFLLYWLGTASTYHSSFECSALVIIIVALSAECETCIIFFYAFVLFPRHQIHSHAHFTHRYTHNHSHAHFLCPFLFSAFRWILDILTRIGFIIKLESEEKSTKKLTNCLSISMAASANPRKRCSQSADSILFYVIGILLTSLESLRISYDVCYTRSHCIKWPPCATRQPCCDSLSHRLVCVRSTSLRLLGRVSERFSHIRFNIKWNKFFMIPVTLAQALTHTNITDNASNRASYSRWRAEA